MNTGIFVSFSEMLAGTRSEREQPLIFAGFRKGFIGSLNLCGSESGLLVAQKLVRAAMDGKRVFVASEHPVHRVLWFFRNAAKVLAKKDKGKWTENLTFFFSGNIVNLGLAPVWGQPDVAILDMVGEKPMGGREYYDYCDRLCRERNCGVIALGKTDDPWIDFEARCDWAADIVKEGDSCHIVAKRHLFREKCSESYRLSDGIFANVAKSADTSQNA